MKVKINNMFGKYNNEIDLDKKCTVFIGENGIGKTTTLKILNYFLAGDFVSLSKYYFESIEVLKGNTKVIINYEDIIINKERLVSRVNNDFFEKYPDLKSETKNKFRSMFPNEYFGSMLKMTSNHYNDLFREINKSKDLFYKTNYFLNKINDIPDESYSKKEFIEQMTNIIKDPNEIEKTENFIMFKYSKLSSMIKNDESLSQFLNEIITFPIMINLASDYKIKNNINKRNIVNKIESEGIVLKIENKSLLKTKYIGLYENYKEKLKTHEKLSEGFKISPDYNLRHNLLYTKEIDYNKILFDSFYSTETIKSFKKDYYNFLYSNIILKQDNKERNYSISDKTYSDIKFNFLPLLPENSIFEVALDLKESHLFNKVKSNYNIKESSLFFNFYEEFKDDYFNLSPKKIQTINILLGKYFKNKEVLATASGIIISQNSDLSYDLNIESLSTGEQKLILLIIIAIVADNAVLLIDEPETSMSIVWQEHIIPDLLKHSSLKCIIVATQSPYILEDESTHEYIVPLSGEF